MLPKMMTVTTTTTMMMTMMAMMLMMMITMKIISWPKIGPKMALNSA